VEKIGRLRGGRGKKVLPSQGIFTEDQVFWEKNDRSETAYVRAGGDHKKNYGRGERSSGRGGFEIPALQERGKAFLYQEERKELRLGGKRKEAGRGGMEERRTRLDRTPSFMAINGIVRRATNGRKEKGRTWMA